MTFLGEIDLLPYNEPGTLEIGCILPKQYQNQRIGSEAVKAFLLSCLEELCYRDYKCNGHPIIKVIGTVHPNNYVSKRIITNLGMKFDKSQMRFKNPRLLYSFFPETVRPMTSINIKEG